MNFHAMYFSNNIKLNGTEFHELEIHPKIFEAVKKAKLKDFFQVLSLSGSDLVRLTKLNSTDVKNLQKAIANVIPMLPPVTALQLANRDCPSQLCRSSLSTGCSILDTFLKGGLLSQVVTEISGESATGKTQICLQLCLTVQLPAELGGLNSGAVYVSTEDVFPSSRLVQMADRLKQRCSELRHFNFTDNVFVEHASDMDDLWQCLSTRVPVLLASKNVRLVVVDSIAALVRAEQTGNDFIKRAKQLSSFGGLLHQLGNRHNVHVVVVNQVTDVFGENAGSLQGSISKCDKVPALGLAWANLMTVRLMLSRTSRSVTVVRDSKTKNQLDESGKVRKETYEANIRQMEVLSAPHLPDLVCYFIVDEDGVKGFA